MNGQVTVEETMKKVNEIAKSGGGVSGEYYS